MTKAELIAELEGLSKQFRDTWEYNDSAFVADECADELDALIAKARQTTDTTP